MNFGPAKISARHKPFLIAELGLNHNSDIEIGKKMIATAAACGADAVKLQSYTTEKFIHPHDPDVKVLYDIFKELELSLEITQQLSRVAANEGIQFFSTPLSLDWVRHLQQMGVPAFKLASGDLRNLQLLGALVETGLPLIISTGAAKWHEIVSTRDFLIKHSVEQAAFLHCVSLYPTELDKINLGRMARIGKEICPVFGFSDHTLGSEAAFGAVLLGAQIIEKHFTLDRQMPGPDQSLSCDPSLLREVREKIDLAFTIMQGQSDAWPKEFESDFYGKRSLYKLEGEIIALRPRRPDLPSADEFVVFDKT